MPTDKERLDFLESLLNRPDRKVLDYQYYKSTDIHITGPHSCSIYARSGVGSRIEFQGYGESVRAAIDMAMTERNINSPHKARRDSAVAVSGGERS